MIYRFQAYNYSQRRKAAFPLFYVYSESYLPFIQKSFDLLLGFPARHASNLKIGDIIVRKSFKGESRVSEEEGLSYISVKEIIPSLLREDDPWHVGIPVLLVTRRTEPLKEKDLPPQGDDVRDLRGGMVPLHTLPESTHMEFGFSSVVGDDPFRQVPGVEGTLFPPTAYMSTKEEITAPACFACPRLPYHYAGDCNLGDYACYSALTSPKGAGMVSYLKQHKKKEDKGV